MKGKWIAIVAVFMLAVLAFPVHATPPTDVHIEVESSLIGEPSPFVASGPAVDSGLICAQGIVTDNFIAGGGFPSGQGFNFLIIKHFICDDGSGEFFVNLQARIDFRKGTTFNWNMIRGTGEYEKIHGAGRGIALYDICGPDCVFDIYDGGLHFD